MTKTIVLGTPQNCENKPIEFLRVVTEDLKIEYDFFCTPSNFNFIELICKRYDGVHDLMLAYNDESRRDRSTLFFGHWNNGTVK